MLMQWSNENIGGRDLSKKMEKHNKFEICADIIKQCGNGLEMQYKEHREDHHGIILNPWDVELGIAINNHSKQQIH